MKIKNVVVFIVVVVVLLLLVPVTSSGTKNIALDEEYRYSYPKKSFSHDTTSDASSSGCEIKNKPYADSQHNNEYKYEYSYNYRTKDSSSYQNNFNERYSFKPSGNYSYTESRSHMPRNDSEVPPTGEYKKEDTYGQANPSTGTNSTKEELKESHTAVVAVLNMLKDMMDKVLNPSKDSNPQTIVTNNTIITCSCPMDLKDGVDVTLLESISKKNASQTDKSSIRICFTEKENAVDKYRIVKHISLRNSGFDVLLNKQLWYRAANTASIPHDYNAILSIIFQALERMKDMSKDSGLALYPALEHNLAVSRITWENKKEPVKVLKSFDISEIYMQMFNQLIIAVECIVRCGMYSVN